MTGNASPWPDELMFVVWAVVAAGAINWGLVGLIDYNVITDLIGLSGNNLDLVYISVGLAGAVDALETFDKLPW